MIQLPRESVEYIFPVVTLDGDPITTGVMLAVTASRDRPTTWTPAQVVDGKLAYLVSGLSVGVYQVWSRVIDNPEVPVVDCGTFRIT